MNDVEALLPHLRLRFNIEHPNLEECYLFGFEAAKGGLDEHENPFSVDSKESFYWQEGYWDAMYEEKPLFDETIPTEPKEIIAQASNDSHFQTKPNHLMLNVIKITGALAATIIVGYQVFALVA